MIEVNNLCKTFKTLKAVDDISFTVKKGEIFGLLGPNGAGKSTTLRILSTLAKPTSGTATIGGYDIVKDDNKVREHARHRIRKNDHLRPVNCQRKPVVFRLPIRHTQRETTTNASMSS